MESIIRDSILEHLSTNNLITPCQHGFLKKHSTGSQLLECINDFTDAIERGNCVDVCFIDFRRAFDTVSLPKLLHKLSAYGISGTCLNWLSEFLSDRTMCTKIDGVFSHKVSQTSGVAQGTVLASLCFVLYINDLPDHIRNCVVKLYADDLKIYYCFKPNL